MSPPETQAAAVAAELVLLSSQQLKQQSNVNTHSAVSDEGRFDD